jgi:hypothetical protein
MIVKKTLLLYCSDEDRRGILAFMLKNAMYNVVGGISTGPRDYDAAIIIDDCSMDTSDLAHHLHPEIPIIVLLQPKRMGINYPERCHCMQHPAANIELLEKIRVLTVRKRGPKKYAAPSVLQLNSTERTESLSIVGSSGPA